MINQRKKRYLRKERDFPIIPYLPTRDLDKTFYYKYFRPYSLDYRRLRMEEDCQCPQTDPPSTKCEWYDPDIIYILETQGDIQQVKKLHNSRSMIYT